MDPIFFDVRESTSMGMNVVSLHRCAVRGGAEDGQEDRDEGFHKPFAVVSMRGVFEVFDCLFIGLMFHDSVGLVNVDEGEVTFAAVVLRNIMTVQGDGSVLYGQETSWWWKLEPRFSTAVHHLGQEGPCVSNYLSGRW